MEMQRASASSSHDTRHPHTRHEELSPHHAGSGEEKLDVHASAFRREVILGVTAGDVPGQILVSSTRMTESSTRMTEYRWYE